MIDARSTYTSNKSLYAWLIVCCGMAFYCYNYFLRVSPSVMHTELTQAFHMTASQLGALSAFYYYAYTLMQVPAGMIYDKFGVRMVLCSACLVAAFGVFVFVTADSFLLAGIGRFLIGLGSAFAYIGTLKLASIWLPPHRFGTIAGLTTAVGMAAGALSQNYLGDIVANIGYKQALHTSLIAGIILSVTMFCLVRNAPANDSNQSNSHPFVLDIKQLLQALKIILSNPQMWIIGLIGSLLYLPASVFLDLWGIPYLKAVHQFTADQAISVAGWTFYGWIISCPLIGVISDKIKRRRLPLTAVGFFAAALLCVVFYWPNLSLFEIKVLFFLIGLCLGAQPLCFALGKENNPVPIAATSVAVTNMIIMLGGAIFQPVVGKLLDMHTTSPLGLDGLPVYTGNDFTFALSVIPIGVALAIFLSLFLKETYCETQASVENEKIFESNFARKEGVSVY